MKIKIWGILVWIMGIILLVVYVALLSSLRLVHKKDHAVVADNVVFFCKLAHPIYQYVTWFLIFVQYYNSHLEHLEQIVAFHEECFLKFPLCKSQFPFQWLPPNREFRQFFPAAPFPKSAFPWLLAIATSFHKSSILKRWLVIEPSF